MQNVVWHCLTGIIEAFPEKDFVTWRNMLLKTLYILLSINHASQMCRLPMNCALNNKSDGPSPLYSERCSFHDFQKEFQMITHQNTEQLFYFASVRFIRANAQEFHSFHSVWLPILTSNSKWAFHKKKNKKKEKERKKEISQCQHFLICYHCAIFLYILHSNSVFRKGVVNHFVGKCLHLIVMSFILLWFSDT